METGSRWRSIYHGSQMQRITLNLLAFSLRSEGRIIMKHMTSKNFLFTFFNIFLRFVLELFWAIFLIPSVFLVFLQFSRHGNANEIQR